MILEELFSGEYNVFKRNFWIVAFAENKRPLEVKSAFAFAMKEDVIAFHNGKMYKKKVEELKAGDFLLVRKGNSKIIAFGIVEKNYDPTDVINKKFTMRDVTPSRDSGLNVFLKVHWYKEFDEKNDNINRIKYRFR